MGFALFGISAPVFWLGLMALWIFWRKLHWTGGTGYTPLSDGVGTWFSHLILPWIVLALLYMAIYARMTRNNLLETLGEDYIRTARAKGLSERQVIFKHGLRASLTPIVTLFGLDVALLVGGAIITESVFNIQGLGWLAINGARQPGAADGARRGPAHRDRGRDHEPRRRHRLRVPGSTREVRVTAAPGTAVPYVTLRGTSGGTPLLDVRDLTVRFKHARRRRAGGLRPLVHAAPRRDARRRRRVRLGQERHEPRDHGPAQPRPTPTSPARSSSRARTCSS